VETALILTVLAAEVAAQVEQERMLRLQQMVQVQVIALLVLLLRILRAVTVQQVDTQQLTQTFHHQVMVVQVLEKMLTQHKVDLRAQ
jgi:hypothetical protein